MSPTMLRITLLTAVLAMVAMMPTAASAAPPTGTPVALIDIGYIFKNHARYKGAREALQQKSKALQTTVNNQRKYLTEQNDELKKLPLGSAEFKQLEAQLTQEASDYQVKNELERKALMEEEVKLYYETY